MARNLNALSAGNVDIRNVTVSIDSIFKLQSYIFVSLSTFVQLNSGRLNFYLWPFVSLDWGRIRADGVERWSVSMVSTFEL